MSRTLAQGKGTVSMLQKASCQSVSQQPVSPSHIAFATQEAFQHDNLNPWSPHLKGGMRSHS